MSMEQTEQMATAGDEQVCCSIQQQILDKLLMCTKPFKALELSKILGIPKSVLNNALYALRRRGKIKCTSETPPLWAYDRDNDGVFESERCLLDLLKMKGSPMSSHSIAWELHDPKSAVNRMLYDLQKIGKVERLQISPPIWKIREIRKSQISSAQGEMSETDFPAEKSSKRQRIEDPENSQNRSNPLASDPAGEEIRDSEEMILDTSKKKASQDHQNNQKPHTCSQKGDVDPHLSEKIANAVWEKYETLHSTGGKVSILAGYVLRTENGTKDDALEVVALGTGTKILLDKNYCSTGSVVYDCHAEIIARRSLLRWLYKQLTTAGEPKSYAVRSEGKTPFKLRPFELWLYCSQAPCGDAALFSRSDPVPGTVPCFTNRNHGAFRSKSERNHGQSFDTFFGNKVSKCLTCSDKLAKRCVVGVQGALLSQLFPPLYMNGIVIGDVFSHAHVARALCCRSDKAISNVGTTNLSSTYSLHHPKIGHWPIEKTTCTSTCRTEKRSKSSLNWALGDEDVEVLDATTGRLQTDEISRISKKAFFSTFLRLCKPSSPSTYKETKAVAVEYQSSKKVWVDSMRRTFSSWSAKPSEVETFYN